MDDGNKTTLLSPGEIIKPELLVDQAIELAEKLYGFVVSSIVELNGYDDKNYHLKISALKWNSQIKEVQHSGYVLKVMNSLDSKKLEYVEGQNELLLHLEKNGFSAPRILKNIKGEYYSVENIAAKEDKNCVKSHVVRLLTYIEGELLRDVSITDLLCYDVGRSVAALDQKLKTFKHKAYDSYDSVWLLKNVPQILNFIYVIKDQRKVDLVKKVVREFENNVLTKLNDLTSGMIHGDANEQNILCVNHPDDKWVVNAILDYGDSHFSAYVFNLAITMAYIILQCKNLQHGRFVLGGYTTIKPLPKKEIDLLPICVSARICQSLVLGAYSYFQDPGNEYVLSTQKSGWEMLFKLSENFDSLPELWELFK